jgi:hypothetical protein
MEGETGEEEEEEDGTVWDWDRWRLHFDQVDEQQRLVSLLKVKLVWGIIFFFGLWFIFWIGKLKFYVLYVFNQLAAFIACVER